MKASLVLILILSQVLTDKTKISNSEFRLREYIFSSYDPNVRPVLNSSHPVVVSLEIWILSLELDLKNEVMFSYGLLILHWNDQYLTWNPAYFGGIETLSIPYTQVWLPDLSFIEAAYGKAEEALKPNVFIYFNGSLRWTPPQMLHSRCSADVSWYPFDSQSCIITFSSWTRPINEIMLKPTRNNLYWALLSQSTYTVTSSTAIPSNDTYPYGTFSSIIFTINFRRKILYHIYIVFIPCIMISCLSLLIFRLSPDAGEKAAFGISILVIFHLVLWGIGGSMPQTSSSIPLIAIYLNFIMTLTCFSILCSVITTAIANHPNNVYVPKWIQELILRKAAEMLQMKSVESDMNTFNRIQVLQHSITKENSNLERIALDNGDNMESSLSIRKMLELSHIMQKVMFHKNELHTEFEKIGDQWRSVALVVDRLFFWFFMILTICGSLIFIFIPQFL